MNEIFENLYDMTAFSNIIAEPQFPDNVCHRVRSALFGY